MDSCSSLILSNRNWKKSTSFIKEENVLLGLYFLARVKSEALKVRLHWRRKLQIVDKNASNCDHWTHSVVSATWAFTVSVLRLASYG
jgi:hypothetical protein